MMVTSPGFFCLHEAFAKGVQLPCIYIYWGAEVLASYIRYITTIIPIPVSESHTSVSMYADDTTIITYHNSSIIKTVFKTLVAFAMVSGLKVNKEKKSGYANRY